MTVVLATAWLIWVLGAGVAVARCTPPRLRRLGAASPRRSTPQSRPVTPAVRAIAAAAVVLVCVVLAPPLVILLLLAWRVAPGISKRRAARRADDTLRDELPDVVDLFVLAVGAGLTVPLAVEAVARHHDGRLGTALGGVARRTAMGSRMAEALAELPDRLGERARPLVTVLLASERYGVALLPSLERLARDVRDERRRHAEVVARRLPVKLLFPLVLCTLPAFALLTVVPLLAGSLRDLRL